MYSLNFAEQTCIHSFIAEGGGKASGFVEFYTNDDLYSVAYYDLDRP